MYCPTCNSKNTKVIDSRLAQDGVAIRRRRECEKCNYRFSTVEEMELLDIVIVKRNGNRESYDRKKISKGILQSLAKRPYTEEKFDKLISTIERDLQKKKKREITSEEIGEIVMKHLKKFDKIAYIRFASIYRSFQDVDKFSTEIKSLGSGKNK
ncbi:MAG: transcriptional regulator NrdR [Candidatus Magasanikbacteria bacterium RIFCSPHIGHO2_01_FULL_33_34]|uniref:Transcriptional repressor NrdR n=1 Tax=Candidatus Magasanikbacteria bacterium RIFCSPHIGHO2_01_FULL_33_34 TaxID=1798671 RepID=A0A1F6LJ87_9BACT|nr:MAG: transcriptional regulator NrdR [Candidatus Magasanikbacteria bacterium RIFCSPHIGHO2_01_FULL_33_34]OGH65477.1 MAG: transcriptional regulator NrdR [Candidatus Magasanikbacteria bacterium RIFCSPHIGHO2_02_FULL_33_17]OGH76187.1 MAG: transcriptional regulator NrdR [Candidatus Magasanikbacteria bacterium RIFCSPLOWO2_01_FULL_33_34]OGH81941.1 MAG: transcriptional regulator NrdR [Candidatus Magasanikbacteria bacterium RIFCSPLOWO2_12_FULL_34_7]